MRRITSVRYLMILALLGGCGKTEPQATADTSTPKGPPEKLPFMEMGDFPYEEGMALPEKVTKWQKKHVEATGYVNPTTRQTKDLKKFLLVKDLGSCCFGKAPQLNHFIEVSFREGQSVHYSRDPITVRGILEIGEVKDGDWVNAVYSMKNAELVK